MPAFTRTDKASDEFTVDKFGAFACGTSRASDQARRHGRRPALPGSAMGRRRVLRLLVSPSDPPTPRRAEPLVGRDCHEVAPAESALALPERARNFAS